MSRFTRAALPLLIGMIGSTGAMADPEALALKRVVLSTGGVGYFEYSAEIEGDAQVGFDVRRDQVDDVLKSVIVFDDKGGVGSVSLAGKTPLREAFRNLPFSENDMHSMADLLSRLKGAEVQVSGNRQARGRILSVSQEPQTLPNEGGVLVKNRLSLLSDDGLVSVLIEDSDEITFTDKRLNGQLAQALAALAEKDQQDSRYLNVSLTGQGKRQARLAYLAETPLWKSSYRLNLPAKGEQAGVQGWAVLENLSGGDWNGVELTLLSGSPSTYRQALYESYFVTRPMAPVTSNTPLDIRADAGSSRGITKEDAMARAQVKARAAAQAKKQADPNAAYAPAPSPAPAMALAEMLHDEPGLASVQAAQSQEAVAQIEFRLPQPVTLKAGETLMVPIIDRTLPAEQVAWYQPQTNVSHPLAAIRLKNTTDTGLPDGLVTVYRQAENNRIAYVGDARLLPMPAGEERILPFALDQKTRIDKEQAYSGDVVSGRIADGVLQLKRVERVDTRYRIAAPEGEARALVIEQPRQFGYELVEPKGTIADGNWRIDLSLAAGESKELLVREERVGEQHYQLVDLNHSELLFYAEQASLSDEQRKAFTHLAELAGKAQSFTQELADRDEAQQRLNSDGERLRANLQSIPAGSDAHKRFLERLENTERQIETLATERATIIAQQRAAERERDEYVKSLSL